MLFPPLLLSAVQARVGFLEFDGAAYSGQIRIGAGPVGMRPRRAAPAGIYGVGVDAVCPPGGEQIVEDVQGVEYRCIA